MGLVRDLVRGLLIIGRCAIIVRFLRSPSLVCKALPCFGVGYDSGDAVSAQYKSPGKFQGGTILGVGVTVEKAQYLDLEREAQGAFARD